jgi:hypothetical protein
VVCAALFALTTAAFGQDLPIVFQSKFDTGGLSDWDMSDAKAWRVFEKDGVRAIELFTNSAYSPKIRSPLSYALVKDLRVTDFSMDARLKSTSKAEPHRDLCLFFGFQDPEHFYYVHLGQQADPHAHSVFLVDGKPRTSIAIERTRGTPWTNDWHRARLVRRVRTGEILVYFDDMREPIMRATDRTFVWGRVGIGSFDNTGMFDDVVVRGKVLKLTTP